MIVDACFQPGLQPGEMFHVLVWITEVHCMHEWVFHLTRNEQQTLVFLTIWTDQNLSKNHMWCVSSLIHQQLTSSMRPDIDQPATSTMKPDINIDQPDPASITCTVSQAPAPLSVAAPISAPRHWRALQRSGSKSRASRHQHGDWRPFRAEHGNDSRVLHAYIHR